MGYLESFRNAANFLSFVPEHQDEGKGVRLLPLLAINGTLYLNLFKIFIRIIGNSDKFAIFVHILQDF